MLIDPQKVLDATDGGLTIILDYIPDAAPAVHKKHHKFKIRPEKTASASLKQAPDGNWIVTDFGGDAKPMNAIALVAFLEQKKWADALHFLAAHYNVDAEIAQDHYQAGYQMKPAPQGMAVGYHYQVKANISDEHRKVLGKFVSQEICDKYNLVSLASYTYVKKDANGQLVQHIFSEKEHYPIFQFEMGTWRKRLEPKALKKDQRFRYDGERPKDFVFGLEQCRQALEDLRAKKKKEWESTSDFEDWSPEAVKRELQKIKLDHIILCSGDRDALNVASLNYPHVIWLNSETAEISRETFKEVMSLTENFYNLPDIDKTGLRQAHKLAMKYLDLKTIELPRGLLKKKDWRGNPCKDLRDWMEKYDTSHFPSLVRSALPYKFWDEYRKESGPVKYQVNNVQLYNFLMKNGFYRIRLEKNKLGYIYIQIKGNVVKEVDPVDIKSFIHDFLRARKMPTPLRNLFFKSTQSTNETSFSHLDLVDIDFRNFTKSSQYFFFKNKIWEVSRKGIREHKYGDINRYVWEDEVIDHDVELSKEAPFTVQYDEKADSYSIQHNNPCLFFRYLHKASRIFWRETDEKGETLTPGQARIEQHHLVNKLYALGYLLHRCKVRSRAWAVYAIDGNIADDISESHGGTGKSISLSSLEYFMRTETVNARNPKIWDSQFMYENVNQYTGFVLFDDANQYFRFDNLYSEITGKWKINPKHGRQFTLDFEESPKLGITSNFGGMDQSGSTARRVLYMVFSDYYHNNENGVYQETRTVADDFGKDLFNDFTEKEWNYFFNTMARAVQLYLMHDKINPPMESVRQRTLRNIMTDSFKDWADVYFTEDSDRLNRNVIRQNAFEDYKRESNKKNITAQRWMKALKAYCNYLGYTLNPEEEQNSDGRIIEKISMDPNQPKKPMEMIHLRTPGYNPGKKPAPVKNLHQQDPSFLEQEKEDDEDLEKF